MKQLNSHAILARSFHDAFIWMLNASILWPEKFDAGEIIGEYWSFAFRKPLTEEDFDESIIDKIRMQLLVRGGVVNPILKENHLTKVIKQNLIFTKEE